MSKKKFKLCRMDEGIEQAEIQHCTESYVVKSAPTGHDDKRLTQ